MKDLQVGIDVDVILEKYHVLVVCISFTHSCSCYVGKSGKMCFVII